MSASTTVPATPPTGTTTPGPAAEANAAARPPRRRVTGVAVTAWVLGLLFCFPALWMVLTSFH
ncbi:hypothetical protein ACFV9O_40190, partial [Streptomyces sp. NPDC059909]